MTSFDGWDGIPVLVGIVALTASTIIVLQRVAAQRFHRADTVPAETVQRRATSTSVVQIAVGAAALTLAGAIQMIGFAGAGTAGGGPPGGPCLEWSRGSQPSLDSSSGVEPQQSSWRSSCC